MKWNQYFIVLCEYYIDAIFLLTARTTTELSDLVKDNIIGKLGREMFRDISTKYMEEIKKENSLMAIKIGMKKRL